jgi:aminoglycoside phosphotransferase (APT) family kinase protein
LVEQATQPTANPFEGLANQSQLPALIHAEKLVPMFDDSTHELWRCETQQGALILKRCTRQQLNSSPFWQVMQPLFGLDLPSAFEHYPQLHASLERMTRLPIPELIASAAEQGDAPAYALHRGLSDETLMQSQLNDQMVLQLAEQLAQLHQQTSPKWGEVSAPQFSASAWPERLRTTLEVMCENQPEALRWLESIRAELDALKPSEFCWVMMDNRWDQYLTDGKQITALVDLDAFVIAPRELELVLLEYQLTPIQAALFKQHYQSQLAWPDLSTLRSSYRLLLFLMNALGETDINRWMNAAEHF